MKTPRKHAELIKQWADGAEIELLHSSDGWIPIDDPMWTKEYEYRIKPEPKPYVVKYCEADIEIIGEMTLSAWVRDNLKLTFHAETGKLIKSEVI